MLHDRNPLLTLLNDKLRVRDYVAAKIGSDYLIPLLWSGENAEEIPFDQLPSKFVIKANHGCEYNILVKDKEHINPGEVKLQLAQWLKENYCLDKNLGIEWGYKNIKPSIMIESFIEENGGEPPIDYKFFCFFGHVEFLTIHFDRFKNHKTKTVDRNFEPHEFRYQFDQYSGEYQRPPNFEAMIKVAESLAVGFNFMRVDIYSVKKNIYFSEFTPYPGGVSIKFLPPRQDYVLGKKWEEE